jgi:probable phosphoglycerate mutase
MKTRLCLIRHGETDWNAQRRVQGQIDIPLNAAGFAQAAAAARALSKEVFAAIYSSDLLRARQTAEPAARARGLPLHTDASLRERHFGILQELTVEEAQANYAYVSQRHATRDPHYDLDGGESLSAFARRTLDGLNVLASRHPGETILIVTHGGVLDIIYRHATGMELEAGRNFAVPNAALNWLERDMNAWRVLLWADRRHLEASLDELPG